MFRMVQTNGTRMRRSYDVSALPWSVPCYRFDLLLLSSFYFPLNNKLNNKTAWSFYLQINYTHIGFYYTLLLIIVTFSAENRVTSQSREGRYGRQRADIRYPAR